MTLGDQIYVYREFWNLQGVYEHHGIDCGDGSVIHYRKFGDRARVERTALGTFTQGRRLFKREYGGGFCFIPEQTLKRAASRLGEEKYNLLFNNCEHFATWCKTGINDSQQIRDFLPAIAKLKTRDLEEPLQQALGGTTPDNAQRLLNQALGDIKVVWDEVQPRYRQYLRERDSWQQVAKLALQRQREDLARAALKQKNFYQQRSSELETQLQQLATLTETLIRNRQGQG
ncbi:MAG: NC domain-containing protein [Chloroflexaceae bacterium]|nr:NC domain-containing protein [Chloroflexaceae bacterium]